MSYINFSYIHRTNKDVALTFGVYLLFFAIVSVFKGDILGINRKKQPLLYWTIIFLSVICSVGAFYILFYVL